MTRCDIIIKGGSIVTMDAGYRILEEHFIAISEGKIIQIAPLDQIKDFKAKKQIDASSCLITPGFINTHSHLGMSYFRGLADDLPLKTWLGDYIWPLETKMLSGDFIYDASLHGASEMIKEGITFSNDMYFHKDRVAEACVKAGLRVNVSQTVIGEAGSLEMEDNIRSLREFKEEYRDQDLVDCSLAPHAIYTCSGETLKGCADAAIQNDWLIHTHLSETRQELEDCLKIHNMRPLDYLEKLGFLEARCVFAHCVWLSNAEIQKMSGSRCSVSLCTDSNHKLSNGTAPLKEMLDASLTLSLGTDSVASNNNLDILEELSFLAKLHKGINHDPTLLPAKEAFSLLTIEGARALGRAGDLGSIEISKQADINIIDIGNLKSQPIYDPYSHLVYAIGSEQIRDQLIAGRITMQDRKLQNVNERDLIQTAKQYKEHILKEMQK